MELPDAIAIGQLLGGRLGITTLADGAGRVQERP
jgi:hypothetical protein